MTKLLLILSLFLSQNLWASFSQIGEHDFSSEAFQVPNQLEPHKEIDAILTKPKVDISSKSLIVLLHGYGLSLRHYQEYANHLASHGFYVVGIDFLRNKNPLDGEHPYKVKQVQFLLDEVQRKYEIHFDSFGVLGHSLGGKIAFMLAQVDPRVASVMALDPVNGGGPPCFISPSTCALYPAAPNPKRGESGFLHALKISSLVMRSAPDRWLNPEAEFNADRFFYGSDDQGTYGLPAPTIYFDMGDRSHASYLPSRGGTTVVLTKRTIIAWFDHTLRDGTNDEYLTGEIIRENHRLGHLKNLDYRL
jgi:pimeloyl-ACP methyl ester carboxylesterase